MLEVAGLKFELRRSLRRSTLGLVVDRGGELVLQAPAAATEEELARWVRTKLLWIHQKLAIKDVGTTQAGEPEFVTGEGFGYLGRTYRLTVTANRSEPLRFDGRRFLLRQDARASGTDHFRAWYVSTGRPWVERRVEVLVPRVGASPSRVEVRDLGYRWGSCGRNRVVFFNWRMLQLPVRLADYVICHELGHLVEPNHGPEFWQLLDRSLPDWQERKSELVAQVRQIYWCGGMAGR